MAWCCAVASAWTTGQEDLNIRARLTKPDGSEVTLSDIWSQEIGAMPFKRPTLPELLERNATDIGLVLPPGDAHLRRHKLALLGKVNAGAAHGMHGHLAWLADQILPDRAEWEMLMRWGSLRDVCSAACLWGQWRYFYHWPARALVRSGEAPCRADGWEYRVSQTTNLDAQGKAVVLVVSTRQAMTATRWPTSPPALCPLTARHRATSHGTGDRGRRRCREDCLLSRAGDVPLAQPTSARALHDYVAWLGSQPGHHPRLGLSQRDGGQHHHGALCV